MTIEYPLISQEQAQTWLGERGIYKELKDLLTYKDWVIVLDRDYVEAANQVMDCYHMDSSNLYAEAWDELKLPVEIVFPSHFPLPFGKEQVDNVKKISTAMEEMIEEFKEYIKEITSDEEGITPEQEQMAEDSLNHLRSLLAKEEGSE